MKNIYFIGAILNMAACTNGSYDSTIASPANKAAADAHNAAMKNPTVLSNQSISETRNLLGEKFRVKDSELLRGTLACVDAVFTVPADALQTANNAPPTAGKARFLPAGSVAVNADIIEAKKSDLYDPKAEGRETAAAPEATVPYLNAATTVAEVVAHNADVATPTSKAYCGTPAAARELIKRCVPTLTNAQLDEAIDGITIFQRMASECSKGATQQEKDLNSRSALASFLSSWLFLKSER